MRNEDDFSLLYKKIKLLVSEIVAMSPPALPRKQSEPSYLVLHYVRGYPEATATAHYPKNLYEHYKPIYFDALDSTINVIKNRFHQPTFMLFTEAEQLLLKAVSKQDVIDEVKVLEPHFKCHYDANSLTLELQPLPTIFECEPINLEDVLRVLQSLSLEKCMLVRNCVTVIRIILTGGAE